MSTDTNQCGGLEQNQVRIRTTQLSGDAVTIQLIRPQWVEAGESAVDINIHENLPDAICDGINLNTVNQRDSGTRGGLHNVAMAVGVARTAD